MKLFMKLFFQISVRWCCENFFPHFFPVSSECSRNCSSECSQLFFIRLLPHTTKSTADSQTLPGSWKALKEQHQPILKNSNMLITRWTSHEPGIQYYFPVENVHRRNQSRCWWRRARGARRLLRSRRWCRWWCHRSQNQQKTSQKVRFAFVHEFCVTFLSSLFLVSVITYACLLFRGYVGIHSSGFRDFLLKSELLLAVTDCGFEHPSEGMPHHHHRWIHPVPVFWAADVVL